VQTTPAQNRTHLTTPHMRIQARLAQAHQKRLDAAHAKACARATKRGRPPPQRDTVYYDHWGYPYAVGGPYMYALWWTPGMYAGWYPGYVTGCAGGGGAGGCVAGTCGGGVAAGVSTYLSYLTFLAEFFFPFWRGVC
jgi:hypothetical protein